MRWCHGTLAACVWVTTVGMMVACQGRGRLREMDARGDSQRHAASGVVGAGSSRASAGSRSLKSVGGSASSQPSRASDIHITRQAALAGGLPGVDFSVGGVGEDLTRNVTPRAGTYLSLVGPPDDPVLFVVKPHESRPTAVSLERAFRRWLGRLPEAQLREAGPVESVAVAGTPRPARAYRVVSASLVVDWCVTALAETEGGGSALLVMTRAPASDDALPRCAVVTRHPRLAPLLATLRPGT